MKLNLPLHKDSDSSSAGIKEDLDNHSSYSNMGSDRSQLVDSFVATNPVSKQTICNLFTSSYSAKDIEVFLTMAEGASMAMS
eukprot:7167870-Ditylum_brightwellii.AAC.1